MKGIHSSRLFRVFLISMLIGVSTLFALDLIRGTSPVKADPVIISNMPRAIPLPSISLLVSGTWDKMPSIRPVVYLSKNELIENLEKFKLDIGVYGEYNSFNDICTVYLISPQNLDEFRHVIDEMKYCAFIKTNL